MTAALAAALLLSQPAAPASCTVSVDRLSDCVQVTLDIEGTPQGLISFDFDPACETMELLSATVARPGEPGEPLPAWAVDTLTGTDGSPLSLVVAVPPGCTASLRLSSRMFDRLSRTAPSMVLAPPVPGASMTVLADDREGTLRWEGEGYSASRQGTRTRLVSSAPAGQLALSWMGTWSDLYSALSVEADSILAEGDPLASREAAIEAGAAGADPSAQLARLRTIFCNSMRFLHPQASGLLFPVRSVEQILGSRTATPLEAAVAFTSVCRRLGMSAGLVFVSGGRWSIPIAGAWNRVLLEVQAGGRSYLLEPSAVLSPAFYVRESSGARMLDGDHPFPRPVPAQPQASFTESWEITGDGRFALSARGTGACDCEIRGKLAGLDESRLAVVLSTWSWRSGFTLEVDSVWTSDLYDLGVPAAFGASGRLPPLEGGYALLPQLVWNTPCEGGFARTWRLPRGSSAGGGLRVDGPDGAVVLADTASRPGRILARLGGPS